MINPFKTKKGLGRGLSSLIGDSDIKVGDTIKVGFVASRCHLFDNTKKSLL